MKRPVSSPSRQKGVTLFIALIALVAMTLAAIALVRSVDTGNQIAGNLAFKQGATTAGDAGVEAARTWLLANVSNAVLNADSPSNGYYATSQDSLDIMGTKTPSNPGDDVDWSGQNTTGYADNACVVPVSSSTTCDANNPRNVGGNTIAYVINRLCTNTGVISGASCISYGTGSSTGSTMGGGGYGSKPLAVSNQVYYKVTVRIQGPRNTVSYIESIIFI